MPTSDDVRSALVRGHGDGSWTRTSDGRLLVRVSREDGTRAARRIPSRKLDGLTPRQIERLALATIKELQDEADAGVTAPSSRQTVADYLRAWMGRRMDANARVKGRGRLRTKTTRHYATMIETHIAPALGHLPLRRLSRPRVQAWITGMTGSPRSIRHRYAVLHNAMAVALADGLVARNPCEGVTLPDLAGRATPILTPEQIGTFLEGTKAHRLHALWAVALATGLRISEILGLAWDDWDKADRLTVRSQLERVPGRYAKGEDGHRHLVSPGHWQLVDLKATRRRDTIALPSWAVEALREHHRRTLAERKPEWPFYGLMFTDPKGMPYHDWAVLEALYAEEKRLGLPKAWNHALRHTNATVLADAGVPEDVRMGRLGHNSQAMARHYRHVTDDADKRAAEALERIVGGQG